jgi:hypothetical protein
VVTVEVFDKMSARQRQALGEEAERLGAFLDAKVELVLGAVTTGGHA